MDIHHYCHYYYVRIIIIVLQSKYHSDTMSYTMFVTHYDHDVMIIQM
jgi:hypothetical protein